LAVLVSHRWLLALHPLDWLGVPGPLSLPLVVVLLLSCALCGAVLVGLWCAGLRRLDPRRAASAWLAALIWGAAEVLLAKGPLFWIGLGSAALPSDRPLAGLAALAGTGLLAAVQLLISWLIWRRLWSLLLLMLVASHGLGLGGLALAAAGSANSAEGLALEVVQPALATRQKFEPEAQLRQRRMLQTAFARASQNGAAAVLLPEGALPLGEALASPAPVGLLSGGFRRQGQGDRSSVLWFPPGSQLPERWLDKHRLVPLGEWLPSGSWLDWLSLSAVGGVEPGSAPRLLQLPLPLGRLAAAICYELADGEALAKAVRQGAGWVLVIANLDPYPAQLQAQFLAQGQLRAIETGRWLLSVGNSGPTAVIDSQGRIRERLPGQLAQQTSVNLQIGTGLTPYDRWAEAPLLLLLAGAGLWRLWQR
jgi:apolipoprotein N-acyltransferase